jgi:hypothetical protein
MRHYIDLMVERLKSLDSRTRTQLGCFIAAALLIVLLSANRESPLVKKSLARDRPYK